MKPAKTDATEAPAKAVARIDFTKPFAVVVDQTESRTNTQIITGDSVADVLDKATAEAARIAISTGRPAAVFGPQASVKTAPVIAADLALDF